MISPAESFKHISLHVNVFSLGVYEFFVPLKLLLMIANRPNNFMKTEQISLQITVKV